VREASNERRPNYEREFISSERQFLMMEISTDHIGSYRRVLQLRVRKDDLPPENSTIGKEAPLC